MKGAIIEINIYIYREREKERDKMTLKPARALFTLSTHISYAIITCY